MEQLGGQRRHVCVDGPAIDGWRIDTTIRIGQAPDFGGFGEEHIMPDLGRQQIECAGP